MGLRNKLNEQIQHLIETTLEQKCFATKAECADISRREAALTVSDAIDAITLAMTNGDIAPSDLEDKLRRSLCVVTGSDTVGTNDTDDSNAVHGQVEGDVSSEEDGSMTTKEVASTSTAPTTSTSTSMMDSMRRHLEERKARQPTPTLQLQPKKKRGRQARNPNASPEQKNADRSRYQRHWRFDKIYAKMQAEGATQSELDQYKHDFFRNEEAHDREYRLKFGMEPAEISKRSSRGGSFEHQAEPRLGLPISLKPLKIEGRGTQGHGVQGGFNGMQTLREAAEWDAPTVESIAYVSDVSFDE